MTEKFSGDKLLSPLIDFNTIIDTDIGLIKFMSSNGYLNPNVFDISFLKRSPYEVISDLYYRKVSNPLYLFAKDNVKSERLDDYYRDFFLEFKEEILSLSEYTDMVSVVDIFLKENSDIYTTILCRDEVELEIIKNVEGLSKVNTVILSEIKNIDFCQYNQFYFRYIEDAKPFENNGLKTFYFSSSYLNRNEDNSDLKNSPILEKIISNRNNVSVIDIYDSSVIRRKE